MDVGFLTNSGDNRGTGNATFDYASFNEEVLGNRSRLYVLNASQCDPLMADKVARRFGGYSDLRELSAGNAPSVLYHIKSGEDDGVRFPRVRYAVHVVFTGDQPHGDRYVAVSEWLARQWSIPFVPHIVRLSPPAFDLRERLGIAPDAVVLGRHGGIDSFDVPWVWRGIRRALAVRSDLYFILMGTKRPRFLWPPRRGRVIFLPATADDQLKSAFIHACDGMLHARLRGETFGLACGEFAVAGKRVLTFSRSAERAHIELLGALAMTYADEDDLLGLLEGFKRSDKVTGSGYDQFDPPRVMERFAKEFLR